MPGLSSHLKAKVSAKHHTPLFMLKMVTSAKLSLALKFMIWKCFHQFSHVRKPLEHTFHCKIQKFWFPALELPMRKSWTRLFQRHRSSRRVRKFSDSKSLPGVKMYVESESAVKKCAFSRRHVQKQGWMTQNCGNYLKTKSSCNETHFFLLSVAENHNLHVFVVFGVENWF